ncbi:unnamed protein product [Urochloa humidicola]
MTRAAPEGARGGTKEEPDHRQAPPRGRSRLGERLLLLRLVIPLLALAGAAPPRRDQPRARPRAPEPSPRRGRGRESRRGDVPPRACSSAVYTPPSRPPRAAGRSGKGRACAPAPSPPGGQHPATRSAAVALDTEEEKEEGLPRRERAAGVWRGSGRPGSAAAVHAGGACPPSATSAREASPRSSSTPAQIEGGDLEGGGGIPGGAIPDVRTRAHDGDKSKLLPPPRRGSCPTPELPLRRPPTPPPPCLAQRRGKIVGGERGKEGGGTREKRGVKVKKSDLWAPHLW